MVLEMRELEEEVVVVEVSERYNKHVNTIKHLEMSQIYHLSHRTRCSRRERDVLLHSSSAERPSIVMQRIITRTPCLFSTPLPCSRGPVNSIQVCSVIGPPGSPESNQIKCIQQKNRRCVP